MSGTVDTIAPALPATAGLLMVTPLTDAAPAASGSGSAGGVNGGLRYRPHLER
jgi:hypothetical protein